MGATRARLRALAGSALLAATTLLAAGCTSPGPDASATVTPTSEGVEVLLDTHCGVRYLVVAGDWFERAGGWLTDGQGNPPPGWGNPYHAGRVVVHDGTARFTDDTGHRELFHRIAAVPTPDCA